MAQARRSGPGDRDRQFWADAAETNPRKIIITAIVLIMLLQFFVALKSAPWACRNAKFVQCYNIKIELRLADELIVHKWLSWKKSSET
jgi:hypothetical protein